LCFDELKTANPNAKVSVKIPVVPGVGIIAVGVAKAGADIITITGYTGGTGAGSSRVVKCGWFPCAGTVTGAAICAEFAIMVIVAEMAGGADA